MGTRKTALIRRQKRSKLSCVGNMDMMFEAYLAHDPAFSGDTDIPRRNSEPIWILGKKYPTNSEEDLKTDILSRLWFSYRKGFVQIGDSGQTSDKGWGCMLRCGQMLIAQALFCLHLGRDWVWSEGTSDAKYSRIVSMFEDRRSANYSIHQIAIMGAKKGTKVGDWFGPNTVAQAIKKLSKYDLWSLMEVHVSLDNIIIVNDIRNSCKSRRRNIPMVSWRPLLLIVPLRLGITDINPVYIKALQTVFTFPQCVGMIGGKPNHALYFIGFVGDEMIYLDPHTTQPVCFIGDKTTEQDKKCDATYHCSQARALPATQMDPSLALGFFCKTEEDFDSLLQLMREEVMKDQTPLFELSDEPPPNVSQNVFNEGSDDDFVMV